MGMFATCPGGMKESVGWLMVNSEGITQSGRLLGRFSFFFEGMVLTILLRLAFCFTYVTGYFTESVIRGR